MSFRNISAVKIPVKTWSGEERQTKNKVNFGFFFLIFSLSLDNATDFKSKPALITQQEQICGEDLAQPIYQISYGEDVLELGGHGVVLHGHEERVQHDADGDGQVHKRIHDN